MKKTSVFAALIAAFALTACGDNPRSGCCI